MEWLHCRYNSTRHPMKSSPWLLATELAPRRASKMFIRVILRLLQWHNVMDCTVLLNSFLFLIFELQVSLTARIRAKIIGSTRSVAADKLCALFPSLSHLTTQVFWEWPACQPCGASTITVRHFSSAVVTVSMTVDSVILVTSVTVSVLNTRLTHLSVELELSMLWLKVHC